jgi:ectoine hydroxylase-related dioxygenase (phytanoyl-CoA dioxygenase family)
MQPRFQAAALEDALEYFRLHGYVIFENIVSAAAGERFWSEVEDNIENNRDLQFSTHGKLVRQSDLPGELREALPRIIDIQGYAPTAARLMWCDPIPRFLKALYRTAPTCLQTLTYKFSSEQGAHSDRYLVSPPYVGEFDRLSLAAVWIPFEPSRTENGRLIVYPGSHKLPKRRLDLDFKNDYGAYVKYLDALCERNGCAAESYEANVGEILFWHGDLVHAGGPILQQSPRPTRKSLVCHYAVVPGGRPSLSADWIRIDSVEGSHYVPSDSPAAFAATGNARR